MTKIWIVIFICGVCTVDSLGQQTCDSLYTIVDQMPVYGKGQSDILEYLAKNLKFSKSCRPEDLRKLTWTINKEGRMIDIDALGVEGQCKANIIEQLKAFPHWTPGRLKGELVCVKMILLIHTRGN